jgi:hypothetical protein
MNVTAMKRPKNFTENLGRFPLCTRFSKIKSISFLMIAIYKLLSSDGTNQSIPIGVMRENRVMPI